MSIFIEKPAGAKPLGDLYASWDRFADVPVSEDGAIEAPFLHFSGGAERETIWRWFESQNPRFIVGDVMNGRVHESYIKAAADSIAELRKVDVFRVIDGVRKDNIDGVTRESLARWIKSERPDLTKEVDEVMVELNPQGIVQTSSADGDKTFSIVSSNMTGGTFAWEGDAKSQRKYLGNREVMAEVKAPNAEIALQRWLEESLEPKAPEDDSPSPGM